VDVKCLQQIVCEPGPSEEVQKLENTEREVGSLVVRVGKGA